MSRAEGRSFRASIVLLLFGPIAGTAHFLLVYLLAEVACAATWLRSEALGMSALAVVTVAFTVVAAAGSSIAAATAYRSRTGAHGDLTFIGFLLGVVFTIEILLVGIPPAFLDPC